MWLEFIRIECSEAEFSFSIAVVIRSEIIGSYLCLSYDSMKHLDIHFDSFFGAAHDCMALALMHFRPGVNLALGLVVLGANDGSEYFVVIGEQVINLHF